GHRSFGFRSRLPCLAFVTGGAVSCKSGAHSPNRRATMSELQHIEFVLNSSFWQTDAQSFAMLMPGAMEVAIDEQDGCYAWRLAWLDRRDTSAKAFPSQSTAKEDLRRVLRKRRADLIYEQTTVTVEM